MTTEWSECMDREAAQFAQDEAEQLRVENKTLQDELDEAYTDLYTMREAEAKLRAELAEKERKLAEALDALVNVYDLCNLPPIWDGNVAAVLAMNGILSDAV